MNVCVVVSVSVFGVTTLPPSSTISFAKRCAPAMVSVAFGRTTTALSS